MKITNLRPKDGFYFKLEAGEIDLYAEDRTNPIRACQLNVDFDIVQPEYKVGDVVEVKTTTDTGYTKPGIEYKGLITQIETKKQERKIQ